MRVVVRVHRSAGVAFFAWMEQNSRPPTGSPEMAALLYDELRAELVRTRGMPPTAACLADANPPYWVWRFNTNTWVRYVLKNETDWPFRGQVLKVVLTDFADTRPA